MHVAIGERQLELRLADITTLEVDVIVNAANAALAGGGGVDGAIHRRGGPQIMEACLAIGGCTTGDSVVTPAGNLKAQWVVHAVAPRYRGRPEDAHLLRSAYESALRHAEELKAASVAFPSLGTGAYGYPITDAAEIALDSVVNHLRRESSITTVTFALFSEEDLRIYEEMLTRLLSQP